MRIALIALGIMLFTSLAHAETEFSVSIGSNDSWFSHSRRHGGFNNGGLSIRYNGGNWGGSYYDNGLGGNYANDRGGYRIFTPRGLDSGSRYYGNYSDASSQWYSRSACGCGHSFCGGGCGRSAYYGGGGTIVIPYGYNAWNTPVYSRQRWQEPVWTAPDYPELGYYSQYASEPSWSDYYADEPRSEREQPLVYNDNRTYNNYYGETAVEEERAPERSVKSSRPVQHEPMDGQTLGYGGLPVTARFREQGRIEYNGAEYEFRVSEGTLSVSSGEGPGLPVASDVNGDSGIYAMSGPGGMTLVFRQDDKLTSAQRSASGKWSVDPLPYVVDFDSPISSGTIAADPWIVFSDITGARYVIAFDAAGWYEVGSGSR